MTSELNDKIAELERLRVRVRELEAEVAAASERPAWAPREFYAEYYATAGFLLGMLGAGASLIVNVMGAPIVGKSPLELIRVYLTFPLGARALDLASGTKDIYAIGDGVILSIGVCLYLGTGMLLGVPFLVALERLSQGKSDIYRYVVASILSVALWIFNFYFVLSWLQPTLFGGNWITDPKVLPVWVGLVTHLIFGWTFAALAPLVRFQPYQQPSTSQN